MGLYALARDIFAMNNKPFPFKDSEEVVKFFNKYEDFKSLDDFNINDFPTERLFVEVIPIYTKIKNNILDLNLDIFDLPFDLTNVDPELPDQFEDSIKDVFVKCFETELRSMDINDDELKKVKYDLLIDELTTKMDEYVQKEEFEQAAIIRDEIKELQSI